MVWNLPGFSSDFSNSPIVTAKTIFDYMITGVAEADGESRNAWKGFNDRRLQIDDHVTCLECMTVNPNGMLRLPISNP